MINKKKMVPRDMQYTNLTVGGILATGKLSYSELKLQSLTANIVAVGNNTMFRKIFTTEELTAPAMEKFVNYSITVDSTNSKVGDRLSLFFVTPFPKKTGSALNINFIGNNVYISNCGDESIPNLKIIPSNSRFMVYFVYTGNEFINTSDTA